MSKKSTLTKETIAQVYGVVGEVDKSKDFTPMPTIYNDGLKAWQVMRALGKKSISDEQKRALDVARAHRAFLEGRDVN